MRGMPAKLREDMQNWSTDNNLDAPCSVFFTPLDDILDQEGHKISDRPAKVSNVARLVKVKSSSELARKIRAYFKKEPPYVGAGDFRGCKISSLGQVKTRGFLRHGLKWRNGSYAGRLVTTRGKQVRKIVKINGLFVVDHPQGQFLFVTVHQFDVVSETLQVVTFDTEARKKGILLPFVDLIRMYGVVPHHDPVAHPNWNIAVIVS